MFFRFLPCVLSLIGLTVCSGGSGTGNVGVDAVADADADIDAGVDVDTDVDNDDAGAICSGDACDASNEDDCDSCHDGEVDVVISDTNLPNTDDGPLLAFPRAEGYGAQALGGRGGAVFFVDTLADSGGGSLRACIENEGPRTCIFRIGGTIVLNSRLRIENPYLTIAGQTAPGGGITLRNSPEHAGSPLYIRADDVIVRYFRARPGASPADTANIDAAVVADLNAPVRDVIIDHCSFSWATDEVISAWYDSKDITFQWLVVSECLNCSTHPKGCHSKGALFGASESGRITLHHTLLAHNNERNPKVSCGSGEPVDVVNNVMYNPGWGIMSGANHKPHPTRINAVGNMFVFGNNTKAYRWEITTHDGGGTGHEIYLEGNIGPHRPDDTFPEEALAYERIDGNDYAQLTPDHPFRVMTRHPTPSVATTTAEQAYDDVLEEAGANRALNCDGTWVIRRDTVDERIIEEVRNRTGSWPDHPSDVGGWPDLEAGTPCPDSDEDGMPTEWENLHSFDSGDPSDRNGDRDGDGYTNLEEYLNGTHPGV